MTTSTRQDARTIYIPGGEITVVAELDAGTIGLAIAGPIVGDAATSLTPEQAREVAGRLTAYADKVTFADEALVRRMRNQLEGTGCDVDRLHAGMTMEELANAIVEQIPSVKAARA